MDQYRKCSDKQRFYASHRKELDEFVRAQKELKELFPSGEVPGMDSLKLRKEELQSRRNEAYESFCEARYQLREFVTARKNVETALRSQEPSARRSKDATDLDV